MISVRSVGSAAELARDGETFLQASSIRGLVAAAQELQEDDPLRLPSGACLEVELGGRDRAALFEALQPAGDPYDLYDRWAEASANWSLEQPEPLDDGIVVNGRPWGWHYISSEQPELVASEERFHLVPMGSGDEVLRLEAIMAASMTGAVITAKLVRWNDLAALAWLDDDSSEGLQWMAAFYDLKDGGLAETCRKFLKAFSSYWSPICPVAWCENAPEWSSPGWEIALNASGSLDESTLADAVGVLYQPCEEHMGDYGPHAEGVLSLAGRDWKWDHRRWVGAR